MMPAIQIIHGKNGFIPMLIPEEREERCLFSYGIKVKDEQINQLKPFCHALTFQPYVNKKENPLWLPYRDEYTMEFYGFTNFHIPYMHIPMTFVHPNWPTEKLWKEIYTSLIQQKKKFRRYIIF